MLYIDIKFVNLLSSKLERFRSRGKDAYNFRCPFCLDSAKDKTKARGNLFKNGQDILFKCFNCDHTTNLGGLLKHVDGSLYRQYLLEKFSKNEKEEVQDVNTNTNTKIIQRTRYLKTPLGTLKKISQLKSNHPAKIYIQSRRIPTEVHYKIFYAPKFFEFSSLFDEKYKAFEKEEPRIIIPFIDRNSNLIAFQGRSLGKSKNKYITVKATDNSPKLFGLDSIDTKKPVFVLEGPIDSMFVWNSIAMAGGDVSHDIIETELGQAEYIYVFDNEPRSIHTIKRMEKIIERGHNITIFPEYIQSKDVNDMILSGMDIFEVNAIINSNVYNGLRAITKLSEWKKI